MDVGRTGAAGLLVLVLVLVLGLGVAWTNVLLPVGEEGEEAGHSVAPHARSVGQQPPPRVAGQDWKPGEHVSGAWGRLDDGAVVVVVEVDDEEEATGAMRVADEDADVVGVALEVEVERGAVTVGVMMTVAVELAAPVSHSDQLV